jgi:hypothetical protein
MSRMSQISTKQFQWLTTGYGGSMQHGRDIPDRARRHDEEMGSDWQRHRRFSAYWIVAAAIAGAVTCRDGWASGSIGSRSACSHHGGVDRSKGGLPLAQMRI